MLVENSEAADAVAQLQPGAAVSVLERAGDMIKVSLLGQEALGDAGTLYSNQNQAAAVSGALEYSSEEPSLDPDTRISWRTAEISGWVHKEALASSIEPAWGFAKAVYEHECARCHAVFGPSSFKANQWTHSINNMRRYTDLNARDLNLVLNYLQHNSKALADF